MSWLEIAGLTKRFGKLTALSDIDLAVEEGEFFSILGPTNAGKTTLLQTVAGLHRPEAGEIRLAGRSLNPLEPKARGVSLLFQNNALFPTLTGFENMAFPLRKGTTLGEAEIAARVAEVAGVVKVPHLLDRPPRTYSGGEQQRVAIARALAAPSDLLMLDEPLTNLDARLRIELRIEFRSLHRDSGQTFLYVTHDQVEAISLSDRMAVLDQGVIQQIGTPQEIYDRPANRFVASFIGMPPMNLLPARLHSAAGEHLLEGAGFRLPIAEIAGLSGDPRLPEALELGVRPEAVRVGDAASDATPFPAQVDWVEQLGSKTVLDLTLAGQALHAVVSAESPLQPGATIHIGFDAKPALLLDSKSGIFLR
ncbi:MAG: ABC transporter ATP-binding protein [Rhodospirillales bacterium]